MRRTHTVGYGDLVNRTVTALMYIGFYAVIIIIGLLVSDVFQAAKSLLAFGVTIVAGVIIAIMLYDGGHKEAANLIMLILTVMLVDYLVDNKMAEAVKNFVAKLNSKGGQKSK